MKENKTHMTKADKHVLNKMQQHVAALGADVKTLYEQNNFLANSILLIAGFATIAGIATAALIKAKRECCKVKHEEILCKVVATWRTGNGDYIVAMESTNTCCGAGSAILCAITGEEYQLYGGESLVGERVLYNERTSNLTFLGVTADDEGDTCC